MNRLKPLLFDLEMRLGRAAFDPRRAAVAKPAHGRVLELGVGTGQNLRFYSPGARVVGVEPDPGMLARARRRAGEAGVQPAFVRARGEALPFRTATFDEAVVTYVL